MQSQQISYRDTGFVSKMICDLFEGKEALSAFYGNMPTLDNFKLQLLDRQENFTQNQRRNFSFITCESIWITIAKRESSRCEYPTPCFTQYLYDYNRPSTQFDDWTFVFFI